MILCFKRTFFVYFLLTFLVSCVINCSTEKVYFKIIDFIQKKMNTFIYYDHIKNNLLEIKKSGLSAITKHLNQYEIFNSCNFHIENWQLMEDQKNKVRKATVPELFFNDTSLTSTSVFIIELHTLLSPLLWEKILSIGEFSSLYLILSSRISDSSDQDAFIHRELSKIPSQFLNLIGGIDFAELHLKEIPEIIRKMQNLKMISLYKNNIKHFPDWFSALRELEIIDIAHNKLENIHNIPTDTLKILYAENNSIQVFDNLNAPFLKQLNLKNNFQVTINSQLLEQCPALEKITISLQNSHNELINKAVENNFSLYSDTGYIELQKIKKQEEN